MQKPVGPDPLSQAMAEPSRRAILESLRFGQKCVTELVQVTGLKQPNVSNHLAKMRQQGIVRAERIGRHVYYSIAVPIADALLQLLESVANPLQGVSAPPESPPESLYGNPYENPHHERAPVNGAPDSLSRLPPVPPDNPAPSNGIDRPARRTGNSESLAEPEWNRWQESYFRNAIAGQEDHTLTLVNSLLARRISLESIYTNVFAPALVRVGELYTQGLADEAHEHLVSAITERMMTKVAQFYTPVARNKHRATLGCVAGNWHMLGLRMLADGLKTDGWETYFLGANVPTASFLIMVSSTRPDLVVISCGMKNQVEELRSLTEKLAASRASTPDLQFQITVGGHYLQAHPELLRGLPIDFTAPDLSIFLTTIRQRF